MIGETIARRSESSSSLLVSTLVHGAIGLAAILLLGHTIAEPPAPKVELVDVTPAMLVDTSSVQASAKPAKVKGSSTASQGRSGTRGHTTSKVAAPITDPYATLTTSVDHGPAVQTGTGSHGAGPGKGLFGGGVDGMPGGGVGTDTQYMGVPSLRRGPSPREDYSSSDAFRAPEQLAGNTVIVDLDLDDHGNVKTTSISKGSGDRYVDADIVTAIADFKFYPALDDAGKPTAAKYRWLWVLQAPFCRDDHSTASHDGKSHPLLERSYCVRAK